MAVDPGALNATLAAFVGDDAALAADLRRACVDALADGYAVLEAAAELPARHAAIDRIEGVAASFGATRLMSVADEARQAPFDPRRLDRLRRAIARLG